MKLVKDRDGYILKINEDVAILFKSFRKEKCTVYLKAGLFTVAALHFDQAEEFYRAWRAM